MVEPKVIQLTETTECYTVLYDDGSLWNGWFDASREKWVWRRVELPYDEGAIKNG